MPTALSNAQRFDIAEEAVALLYGRKQGLAERYGPTGRGKCVDDTRQTLMFLCEALDNDSYPLFSSYVAWLKALFTGLHIDIDDLSGSLDTLSQTLARHLPAAEAKRAAAMLSRAMAELDVLPVEAPSFIAPGNQYGDLTRSYLEALLSGDRRTASRLVLDRVEAGMPVREIYLDVFQPALREVGRLWQSNRITVAHEHFVTAATQAIMSQLYPYIFTGEARGRTMVATCVSGDLHEVGLRMVADCFEMAGWDSHYLGANTPSRDVVTTLRERKASVLGLSVTIASHLKPAAELISMAREAMGADLVILVGGYPFIIDPNLWRRIGADGMADSAGGAVHMVEAIEAAR
jgi:methylmalonyl-CoA mutase cobalamin-binding domain/chain